MQKNKLVIADIQTSDLLYYDPAFGEKAYEFCCKRDIDCLPSLDDPKILYQRNDKTKDFDQVKLTEDRRILSIINIFKPALLKRFQDNPILFVQDHEELSGVIHFSDYNKSIVSNFLYQQISAYERNLRRLAELNDLDDEDMGAFFSWGVQNWRETNKSKGYFTSRLRRFEKRSKNNQVPPLQQFYLSDLIAFLKYKEIIELQDEVNQLRNTIMHANELVNMVDVTTPDYIYDIATFEIFFNRVQALIHDAGRVKNRIRLITGIDDYWPGGIADAPNMKS